MTAPAGKPLKPPCEEQPIKMRPSMFSSVPALEIAYIVAVCRPVGICTRQKSVMLYI